jgi:hypothetical protein
MLEGHHRRIAYVVLRVDGVGLVLRPHQENEIMLNLTVGHTATMAIEYLDQNGNPMLTAPVPDSAPTWTDTPSSPPVDTFTPAAGGLTATLAAIAPGSDTVTLAVTVSGKTYNATLVVTISAAPQVLTSIAIVPTVQSARKSR